jgi:Rod binding domain-containing protein
MAGIENFVASRYDFQGLASLKSNGSKDIEKAKEINAKVAAEFESMFLKQLTDSMRASLKPFKSDLINTDSMELFEGMFYDEVSHKIAQSQGLGLVEWLNDITEKQEPTANLISALSEKDIEKAREIQTKTAAEFESIFLKKW